MPAMATSTDSHVDLLIVGAGPAGLMLAAWASQYDIHTRIVDNKGTRVQTGQADGLHSRTQEILHSFGLQDRFLKNSFKVNEICSWNPDPRNPNSIVRTQRAVSQPPDLSIFPQISLNQGLTEQILLDYLDSKGRVGVERNTRPNDLRIDDRLCENEDAHPVTVVLRKLANDNDSMKAGSESSEAVYEMVRAKYVVGCDGGHSWVRRQLGIPMEGECTNKHFGVMDIVPLTDFPDIRESCVMHSNQGSVMTIPREGRLVRLYVQLAETVEGEPFDRASITPEVVLRYAKDVFRPYSLDFRICDWQSVYTIGQRVAPRFSHKDRVFLAGDAVHTHSPMMGQGMNVSMQDAYNLGWKLGSVLSGTTYRDILATYDQERRPIANELIALDTRMSKFYSDGPSKESGEYQVFRDSFSRFLSGVSVTYGPSVLVAGTRNENEKNEFAGVQTNGHLTNGDAPSEPTSISTSTLAKEIHVGQRIPSHRIVCQAEANPVHLADVLPSNGKWRIIVFAGDLSRSEQFQAAQQLGPALESLVRLYAEPGQGLHSTVEVLLIHSGSRETVNLLDLHEVYHPWDDELGWDYWKVFSDDVDAFEACEKAYDLYGIDKRQGCVVILRPDQHVSYIRPLDEHDASRWLFSKVLIPKQQCLN